MHIYAKFGLVDEGEGLVEEGWGCRDVESLGEGGVVGGRGQ